MSHFLGSTDRNRGLGWGGFEAESQVYVAERAVYKDRNIGL